MIEPPEWMHWTIQTAIIFLLFGVVIILMVIINIKRGPGIRKGWLPFPTSRGDRLFLSTISMAVIGLLWLKLFGLQSEVWGAFITSLIAGAIIMKYA